MLSPSVRSSGAIVALPPAVVDALLDFLERGGGPGDEDHVRACRSERFRSRRADPAARRR